MPLKNQYKRCFLQETDFVFVYLAQEVLFVQEKKVIPFYLASYARYVDFESISRTAEKGEANLPEEKTIAGGRMYLRKPQFVEFFIPHAYLCYNGSHNTHNQMHSNI